MFKRCLYYFSAFNSTFSLTSFIVIILSYYLRISENFNYLKNKLFEGVFIAFATYLYVNGKNEIDSVRAFVTLALFNNIRITFFMLGPAFSSLIQVNIKILSNFTVKFKNMATFFSKGKVSLKRIQEYLVMEEIDSTKITHLDDSGEKILSDF